MAGGLIATIGFVACTFSTNIPVMMVTYGVVGGKVLHCLIGATSERYSTIIYFMTLTVASTPPPRCIIILTIGLAYVYPCL